MYLNASSVWLTSFNSGIVADRYKAKLGSVFTLSMDFGCHLTTQQQVTKIRLALDNQWTEKNILSKKLKRLLNTRSLKVGNIKKLGKVDTHGDNYNALIIVISVDAVSFALLASGAHLETLLIMRNKSKVTWISAYS